MADGAPLAMVTGAAGGIGTALAHRLANDGWRLHLVDIDQGRLDQLSAELPGRATNKESRLEDREACVDALPDGEEIDALVHLAGIFVADDLEPESRDIYGRTMQANATNAWDLAGAALPHMRDGASMVFTSSMAFNRGAPDRIAYSMAKGAIVGLTRALSRRVGGRGINVNAVAPGIIDTSMPRELINERGREALMSSIPLGRFGQPEEVASVIAFLISEDASYMTGQVINIDGGIING
ncbi:MAG: SDR family NAD(P)-dependent oxidoreductase [Rhodospirillales bacterium]|nr:SDR family NAD(P)-dependent oxidoreductase [Rhodospirillales bacterium]